MIWQEYLVTHCFPAQVLESCGAPAGGTKGHRGGTGSARDSKRFFEGSSFLQPETSPSSSYLEAQGKQGRASGQRIIDCPTPHPKRASLAWRAAGHPLPSCLPLEGDADQLELHSLF